MQTIKEPARAGKRLLTNLAAMAVGMVLSLTPAAAATVYEEVVFGDLSDDHTNPTTLPLPFSPGSNLVSGTSTAVDRDFFTTTIAPGQILERIILITRLPASRFGFLGVYEGPTYAQLGNVNSLGYVLYDTDDSGTDLLPAMGASNGNFSGPLPAGTYSFWFDSSQLLPEPYAVDVQVAANPVPEPGSGVLACLSLVMFAARRRRTPR